MHKLLNIWCKETMSEDIGSQTDLALNSPAPFINRVTLGTFLNLFESLLICKMGMKILTISNGCYEAFTFIIVTRISIKMYYGRTTFYTNILVCPLVTRFSLFSLFYSFSCIFSFLQDLALFSKFFCHERSSVHQNYQLSTMWQACVWCWRKQIKYVPCSLGIYSLDRNQG